MENSRFETKEVSIMEFLARFMAHIPTRVSVDDGAEQIAYGTAPLPFDYDIEDEEVSKTKIRREEAFRWIAKQFPDIERSVIKTLIGGSAVEKNKTLANLAKRMRFTIRQRKEVEMA